jgi:hypothetical protein
VDALTPDRLIGRTTGQSFVNLGRRRIRAQENEPGGAKSTFDSIGSRPSSPNESHDTLLFSHH